MSNIELVVKIPEDEYKNILLTGKASFCAVNAIEAGTPLPKGHGDIVDIETLIDMFWDGNSMEITKYDLSVIEPIIEADKESGVSDAGSN